MSNELSRELDEIEHWFNKPSEEESHWQRVFNGGRVIARLIAALRTCHERIEALEGVEKAARAHIWAVKNNVEQSSFKNLMARIDTRHELEQALEATLPPKERGGEGEEG